MCGETKDMAGCILSERKGEERSLRKVSRRFIWHDRIHVSGFAATWQQENPERSKSGAEKNR